MGIKFIAAFGIFSGFIVIIAAPVLAQGPAHAKVTMSSEDFARNRASFVEGQTVDGRRMSLWRREPVRAQLCS